MFANEHLVTQLVCHGANESSLFVTLSLVHFLSFFPVHLKTENSSYSTSDSNCLGGGSGSEAIAPRATAAIAWILTFSALFVHILN